MDFHSNLEYLCRVCAANTKGKNSVPECAYILKTPGLKDKLDRFLYLKIFENDALPKVLCKSCFRQVEATASLSKIAKHTQQVFRDFLLSNLPKGPPESTRKAGGAAEKNTSEAIHNKPSANQDKHKKDDINDETLAASLMLAQIPAQLKAVVTSPPTTRKEDLVVNVSVADPLTRDNQQKMISNSQRRQSLLIESRYTPKTIAQKTPATIQKLITPPKAGESAVTGNTTINNQKSLTPLNYFPIKAPEQQIGKQLLPTTTTQITTFSSGGYVIGRPTNNDHLELKKINLPLATAADNVLQQKRKNLVKALNNIKANNTGQVSLLKSSQHKQSTAATSSQNARKTPLAEVVNQAINDELPEKIIIAAPKNKLLEKPKGKEPLNLSGKQQVIPAIPAIPQMPTTTATITPVMPQTDQQALPFGFTPVKPGFPEEILLGRVIRDMDLLKLILKALKWPVNKQNAELQLQRLKNSKFTDIMSDANLLQDTDLTQLLGPYLAPVLLAAQVLQQQQQHIFNSANISQQNIAAAFLAQTQTQAQAQAQAQAPTNQTTKPISAMDAAQAEINKTIPYKLPPETSVQLVPATPEDTDTVTKSPPLPNLTSSSISKNLKRDRQKDKTAPEAATPPKRQRREAAQRARASIVISDEDDDNDESEEEVIPKSKQRSAKAAPNIQIELNPNLLSQFGFLNGSTATTSGYDTNAALLALLQRQKTALMKSKKAQRRRRNSVSTLVTLPPSEFDALIDLDDDIVLMEPVTTTSSVELPTNTKNQESIATPKTDAANPFIAPALPLITRPIIKRRKTVIHSSKGRYDLSIELREKEQGFVPTSTASPAKGKRIEETNTQVSTNTTDQVAPVITNDVENPTQNVNAEASTKNSLPAADTSPAKVTPQKKLQSKAALGQQLLEAIGLQKISTTINSTAPQTETATSSSSTPPNAVTVLPNAKQSVQQIRSALKKSLKQAQEQQQQKRKELFNSATNTIIQDADSTTKPSSVLKEIVVVEGKGNTNDNSSSLVDVEEQIDNVTIMIRNNDKDKSEQSSTATAATNEKEDKKEIKKSATAKIPEKRRTLLGSTSGNRHSGTCKIDETEDEKTHIEEEDDKEDVMDDDTNDKAENKKPEKVDIDSFNISSASETNVLKKEMSPVATPRRRGRKRVIEKQNDTESSSANDEKEKESKSTATITKDDEIEAASGDAPKKEEDDFSGDRTPSRPTRQSKTLSKYYKGPDKPRPSRRSLPSRTTRNR